MKKLYLKNFEWPLFRDYGTFPPEDGPAGFVAGREAKMVFQALAEGLIKILGK